MLALLVEAEQALSGARICGGGTGATPCASRVGMYCLGTSSCSLAKATPLPWLLPAAVVPGTELLSPDPRDWQTFAAASGSAEVPAGDTMVAQAVSPASETEPSDWSESRLGERLPLRSFSRSSRETSGAECRRFALLLPRPDVWRPCFPRPRISSSLRSVRCVRSSDRFRTLAESSGKCSSNLKKQSRARALTVDEASRRTCTRQSCRSNECLARARELRFESMMSR
mmetsp:Transcript_17259/g.49346  ORF Transcript_17259/g.49346 Transcript_17259/m.49346 type:complete len:228 (+) Transcript_17259:600-1283(+)